MEGRDGVATLQGRTATVPDGATTARGDALGVFFSGAALSRASSARHARQPAAGVLVPTQREWEHGRSAFIAASEARN